MAKRERKSTPSDSELRVASLASYWGTKFKEAMVAKSDYTKRWLTYFDAYRGDYFKNKNLPDYKSDLVSNYIFSIIETIRPIMLDHDPKFQAMPRTPEGMGFANDLQDAFSYEWDRESVALKVFRELITTLVTGSSIFFTPWDSSGKQIHSIPVNVFNIFPDPLATGVFDAEYIIYASYRNAFRLKRQFPSFADKLVGGDVNYGELVHDNNKDAKIDNQILVLEVWTHDDDTFTNQQGVTVQRYPNGRVITIAPELGLVLADKANPYKDGKFPFLILKDYDIPGKFWGEGEVAQLLSPQKYMNELNNAILDNAKTTANMPWIVDKNSGIGYGKITGRPGLVIRKNPGSDVHREQPPSMPSYVVNAVETYKSDMEQISGIFDTLKGNSETGVYTAQGILALQEAGQARIRLKVKIMEDFLGKLAQMWYERMKQFWKEDRWIRIVKPDGSYDFHEFTAHALEHDFDIKIMAGSTMPVNRGAMLDLMIRLAQTQMSDGQPLVDREAVAEYLPAEVRSAVLSRMQNKSSILTQHVSQLADAMKQITQEVQGLSQESQASTKQTDQVISQIADTLDTVNKKILQLQKEHDKMNQDRQMQEQQNKIRTDAYNQGYGDAEKLYSSTDPKTDIMHGQSLPPGKLGDNAKVLGDGLAPNNTQNAGGQLPNDILNGIENLSDSELSQLLQQNPQLSDLLK